MRILKLTAENVKKLTAVEISPNGDVVQISGRNGAGKSSVLDSIWWALAGADSIQSKPIREGQKKARIKLDLGEIVVERRFTEKGSRLDVTSSDGLTSYKSPQKMLDELIGQVSFDPLSFMRMNSKQQAEMLCDLCGLDLADQSAARQDLYEERRDVNRDLTKAKAALSAAQDLAPKADPGPAESMSDLLSQLDEARKHNDSIAELEAAAAADDALVTAINQDIEVREAELKELRVRLQHAQGQAASAHETAKLPMADTATLHERLQRCEQQNELVALWARLQGASEQAKKLEALSGDYTSRIHAIDDARDKSIADAPMPLDGLSVGDGVIFNGLPLEQASQAEQLKVSMAMAMAMNPKIRVIRITDASLLDEESMSIVASLAGENDFQVWLEVVDTSGKVGIVIEDGAVLVDNQAAA